MELSQFAIIDWGHKLLKKYRRIRYTYKYKYISSCCLSLQHNCSIKTLYHTHTYIRGIRTKSSTCQSIFMRTRNPKLYTPEYYISNCYIYYIMYKHRWAEEVKKQYYQYIVCTLLTSHLICRARGLVVNLLVMCTVGATTEQQQQYRQQGRRTYKSNAAARIAGRINARTAVVIKKRPFFLCRYPPRQPTAHFGTKKEKEETKRRDYFRFTVNISNERPLRREISQS